MAGRTGQIHKHFPENEKDLLIDKRASKEILSVHQTIKLYMASLEEAISKRLSKVEMQIDRLKEELLTHEETHLTEDSFLRLLDKVDIQTNQLKDDLKKHDDTQLGLLKHIEKRVFDLEAIEPFDPTDLQEAQKFGDIIVTQQEAKIDRLQENMDQLNEKLIKIEEDSTLEIKRLNELSVKIGDNLLNLKDELKQSFIETNNETKALNQRVNKLNNETDDTKATALMVKDGLIGLTAQLSPLKEVIIDTHKKLDTDIVGSANYRPTFKGKIK